MGNYRQIEFGAGDRIDKDIQKYVGFGQSPSVRIQSLRDFDTVLIFGWSDYEKMVAPWSAADTKPIRL